MKYMVIEDFKPDCRDAVYARYRLKGRMLPEGLYYLDSWLSEDGARCFQLMETEQEVLFESWVSRWDDLVDFEVVPVHDSPTKTVE